LTRPTCTSVLKPWIGKQLDDVSALAMGGQPQPEAGTREGLARNKAQLKRALVGDMHKLSKSLRHACSFFGHLLWSPTFRCAA
jgi:hypothetical protein